MFCTVFSMNFFGIISLVIINSIIVRSEVIIKKDDVISKIIDFTTNLEVDDLTEGMPNILVNDVVSENLKEALPSEIPEKKIPKRTPVKLTMKQGLLINQVLSFYALEKPEDEICMKHTKEFKEALRAFEPWALKMFDSNSKLQSGILLGNLFEFGSFQQCLEIDEETESGQILGKHCRLKIKPSMSLMRNILGFRNVSDKRFEKVKILVEPQEVSWSVCVPHSCPAYDIEKHFNKKIMEMLEGLELNISLQEKHCNSIFHKPKFGKMQVFTLIFLGLFFLTGIVTAVIDYQYIQKGEINTFFNIFSAYTNLQKINAKTESEFDFLHGLRFMSTCYVVLGHRYIMFMADPTVNGLGILEWEMEYPSTLILGSTVSVDSFFMISGMLVGVGFFDHVEKTKKFNLQLTAPLAINLLIWCTLVQFLGSGTLMFDVYTTYQKPCQDYWWSTLLHIQSFINPGIWCNYPIWYLSCEMPFYYLSPIMLYPLWKWPTLGLINCICFILLSIGISFYLAVKNRYSGDMLEVTSRVLVTDYFKYYYTQPHVRISPYIIGIVFGYFLFKTKEKNIKISKTACISLWMLALSVMGTTIISSRILQLENHEYNPYESASYLAFSRSAWTLCLVWVIWACKNGYGGIINDIMSAHFFRVLSRISYSVFLFHTIVQLYIGGNMKVPIYFSNFNAIYYAVADITIVTLWGFLFTLFFEVPLLRAEGRLFNPKKVQKVKPKEPVHVSSAN
ncbi:unnamed protein product [Brassicogethes aeneus]|uniref:Nose resistant-to-fluoxetine protein N-terminal domain-containing protein n=1 Tax=Brassicogethes aeneus TaxID=1431903 RepID=A0A9P0B4K4_BRAAE|nr:unnamed protein product [Brassicogethes aeneus]